MAATAGKEQETEVQIARGGFRFRFFYTPLIVILSLSEGSSRTLHHLADNYPFSE